MLFRKKTSFLWTNCLAAFILCSLTCGYAGHAEELIELRQYLAEARAENRTLAEQKAALEQELAAAREELAQLRSRYAEMVMRSETQGASLAQMEMAAANLLRGGQGASDGAAERLQLLEALGEVRRGILQTGTRLRECNDAVAAMMDICQPSAALRQECDRRFQVMKDALAGCLKAVQTDGASRATAETTCAITQVDAEVQLALVDQGGAAGLRLGSRLKLLGEAAGETLVRVVALRHEAAVVQMEQGDFKALVPGLLLKQVPNAP